MRINEIGGDFYNIPIKDEDNHLFSKDTKWFISGRAALDFVINDIKYKHNVTTACLPSYCCESMIEPFLRNSIKVSFYSVTVDENGLKMDLDNIDTDILLLMNYFGFQRIHDFDYDGIVINDITQSVFCENKKYDYEIGSLRKWAGFITGGFANCKEGFDIGYNQACLKNYTDLRIKAMNEKEKYINEFINNKDFLDVYKQAEALLDDSYNYGATDADVTDAKKIDVEFIEISRKENARKLLLSLKDKALFKQVKESDCPLFVPIIVDNRDKLRDYLIEKSIYCPVHWPISKHHILNDEERYIYDHELSIVCDQRYSLHDMQYICDCIKEYKC